MCVRVLTLYALLRNKSVPTHTLMTHSHDNELPCVMKIETYRLWL